jgi:hypothetical protein
MIVDRWLASPSGQGVWTFGHFDPNVRRPRNTNRVGLVSEIPDMDAYRGVMASEAKAEAMKTDGVRPETLVVLIEG